jgi:hypothetical protein
VIEAHGARSPVALGPFAKQSVEVLDRRLSGLFGQQELDLVDEPAADPRIASVQTQSVGFAQEDLFVDELRDDALPLIAFERAQKELFPPFAIMSPGLRRCGRSRGREKSVADKRELRGRELQQRFGRRLTCCLFHAPG